MEQRSMIARDMMEWRYKMAWGECDGTKIYNSEGHDGVKV